MILYLVGGFALTAFLVLAAILLSHPLSLEESIACILEKNGSCTIRGWHIYKDRTGMYTVLNFNTNVDVMPGSDRRFEMEANAIAHFMEMIHVDDSWS